MLFIRKNFVKLNKFIDYVITNKYIMFSRINYLEFVNLYTVHFHIV